MTSRPGVCEGRSLTSCQNPVIDIVDWRRLYACKDTSTRDCGGEVANEGKAKPEALGHIA